MKFEIIGIGYIEVSIGGCFIDFRHTPAPMSRDRMKLNLIQSCKRLLFKAGFNQFLEVNKKLIQTSNNIPTTTENQKQEQYLVDIPGLMSLVDRYSRNGSR